MTAKEIADLIKQTVDEFVHHAAITPLKIDLVPIHTAGILMGGKANSEVYRAAGMGEIDIVKDGGKSLVRVDSIYRRNASLPPAKIKQYARLHTAKNPADALTINPNALTRRRYRAQKR